VISQRQDIAAKTYGWLNDDEGPFLRGLALSCVGPYLEVGSYCGKSTVWIGDAAETNGTVLFALDHHQGSPEMMEGSDCFNPAVIDEDGSHDTLTQFRRTLRSAGLQDSVVPVVGATEIVGPLWAIPLGFVFVDGSHSYEGCSLDAKTWGSWLRPNGLMAFHDVTIPDIAKAIDETLEGDFEEVDPCNTVRVIRKCS
jgi:MMP 1-O-methyltransferase